MLVQHSVFMTLQLVDSRLPTTREFWRRKLGVKEEFATDPRCMAEIVAEEIVHGRSVFVPAEGRAADRRPASVRRPAGAPAAREAKR